MLEIRPVLRLTLVNRLMTRSLASCNRPRPIGYILANVAVVRHRVVLTRGAMLPYQTGVKEPVAVKA